MDNDIYIYIIIFLLCIILVGSFLFFNIHKAILSNATASDSLAVEDSLAIELELEPEPEPEPEPPRRSFIDRRHETVEAEMEEHDELYLELVRQIQNLFSPEPEVEEVPIVDIQAQFDSTLAFMMAQKDSLHAIINNFSRENKALQDTIYARISVIESLISSVESLQDSINTLREQVDYLENIPTEVIEVVVAPAEPAPPLPPPPDYRQLARIYNGLDAKRIATLMQQMPAEHSVEVLKLLNQRKQAQVIVALPQDIATQYSNLLLIGK